MSLIPKLKKTFDNEPPKKEEKDAKRDVVADVKEIDRGIQAMSENMATADITSVAILQSLQLGKPLDMEDMKVLAHELGEIYNIVSDLLDIMDEYVPPEE